jgi:hypothetical protein
VAAGPKVAPHKLKKIQQITTNRKIYHRKRTAGSDRILRYHSIEQRKKVGITNV